MVILIWFKWFNKFLLCWTWYKGHHHTKFQLIISNCLVGNMRTDGHDNRHNYSRRPDSEYYIWCHTEIFAFGCNKHMDKTDVGYKKKWAASWLAFWIVSEEMMSLQISIKIEDEEWNIFDFSSLGQYFDRQRLLKCSLYLSNRK